MTSFPLWILCTGVLLEAACQPQAPAAPAPSLSAPPPTPTTSALAAQPSASVVSSSQTPVSAASSQPPSTPPWQPSTPFKRLLPHAVHSIALGRTPFVAALSDQPWRYDGKHWQALPLPSAMVSSIEPSAKVGIYFGRDDQPRIMGTRQTAQGDVPVYLRHRGGAWQADGKEIGRLAGAPRKGLYGVLGEDDPEVVCKVSDVCIIKRRSGWQTIPAGGELARTYLCNGTAWTLDSKGLSRLDRDGWKPQPWDFPGRSLATGFWADTTSSWWVSVGSQDAVYRYEGGKWTSTPSPVSSPGALWAASASDAWMVGKDGVAHFDGAKWRRVEGLTGEYSVVAGRDDMVWVGGPSGLWEGKRAGR